MKTSTILSVIGLSLDMIGVIVIFLFGISPKLDVKGQIHIVTGGRDINEIKKAKCYKWLSWTGLFLVFIGFFIQLLSYLVK